MDLSTSRRPINMHFRYYWPDSSNTSPTHHCWTSASAMAANRRWKSPSAWPFTWHNSWQSGQGKSAAWPFSILGLEYRCMSGLLASLRQHTSQSVWLPVQVNWFRDFGSSSRHTAQLAALRTFSIHWFCWESCFSRSLSWILRSLSWLALSLSRLPHSLSWLPRSLSWLPRSLNWFSRSSSWTLSWRSSCSHLHDWLCLCCTSTLVVMCDESLHWRFLLYVSLWLLGVGEGDGEDSEVSPTSTNSWSVLYLFLLCDGIVSNVRIRPRFRLVDSVVIEEKLTRKPLWPPRSCN